MNEKILKFLFWVSFIIMCSSLIGWVYSSYTAVDFTYENDLYQKRFDSMDMVDDLFPVKNQTLNITNVGWVDYLDGYVLKFNQSYYGTKYFLFDGWELKEVEYS